MVLTKDPDAVLDYAFDMSLWLETGETILTGEVVVEEGDVVIDSVIVGPVSVVAWLSGGTLGTTAELRCRVETTEGRIDDRSMTILIREWTGNVGGCEPWPIIGCDTITAEADVLAAATTAAQQFLSGLVGHRLGVCTYVQRYQVRARWDYCRVPAVNGQCCAIPLVNTPVRQVLEVRVDDVPLATNSYSVVGGNRLVRSGCWPVSLDCEPGRIIVTYTAGIPLHEGSPYHGMAGAAMGEMVREYVDAICGRPCKLPSRFVSVSRQGVSTVALDPAVFLRLGLTGLPMTDNLVRTMNPNGLKRRPRVISIDGPRRH